MNADSSLVGFKDHKGNIRIPPKFETYSPAQRFEDIIAVHERVAGKITSYYLTKSGKIAGRNSMYIFDNTPDCESEGFIRFRDPKTDKAGLLNKQGNIVIPAIYNDLSRVENGLVIVLSGAVKKSTADGEHTMWEGGRYMLIDTTNRLLIENFAIPNPVSLHTLQLSDNPGTDPERKYYRGVNGRYYGFIDTDAEFKRWFRILLTDISKTPLRNATFHQVKYWQEAAGWLSASRDSFIDKNFELLRRLLLRLKSPDARYDTFNESLNPYLFDSEIFSAYFNNCNEARESQYPVKNVVVNHGTGGNLKQDHFTFLRTDSGYKLISVSLSTEQLK